MTLSESVPVYPTDTLIAVFDEPGQAEHAAAALRRAGFPPSDIKVIHGTEGLAAVRETIESENPIQRAWRAAYWAFDHVSSIGTEASSAREYLETLEEGKSNLLVYCPTDEQRAQATDILRADHGYELTHHGTWVKEAL